MTRDWSVPVTPAEREEMKATFRSMPTCKDGHIAGTDISSFCRAIGFHRTPQQVATYEFHVADAFGGKWPLEAFIDGLDKVHNSSKLAQWVAKNYDKNGDGVISEEEYTHVAKYLVSHDPSFVGIGFASFLAEADTDKDGKVDVEEFANWIQTRAPSQKFQYK